MKEADTHETTARVGRTNALAGSPPIAPADHTAVAPVALPSLEGRPAPRERHDDTLAKLRMLLGSR